jgi:hypothetical protein
MTDNSILTGKKNRIASQVLLERFECDLPLKEFVFTTKFVEINSIKVKVGYVCLIKREVDESPVFG